MSIFGGGGKSGSQSFGGGGEYVPPGATPSGATGAAAGLPQASPNPPIYGSNQTKAKGSGATQAFNSTVIGSLPQQQVQRTVLGTAA